MAKTKIPDPLARRHLLESTLAADKAAELATAYLEAGREVDAIEFLARAEDRDRLQALQEVAIERGDVFLLRASSAGLGEEPHRDRWLALEAAAKAAGRVRDAESAKRIAAVEG